MEMGVFHLLALANLSLYLTNSTAYCVSTLPITVLFKLAKLIS